ncbi:MAG: 50S ribosomal protein L18 [Nitrospiraceae bacterium]|nr:50S ribosomal protein L18 [Nitrospiraceae bacterium]
MTVKTLIAKDRRHERVRKKLSGSAERPRISVYRSLKYVYAQLIDDEKGATVAAASSIEKDFSASGGKNRGNKEMARKVGALLAKRARDKGVSKAVFDRSGYKYHGCIKELAEGAREGGLEF